MVKLQLLIVYKIVNLSNLCLLTTIQHPPSENSKTIEISQELVKSCFQETMNSQKLLIDKSKLVIPYDVLSQQQLLEWWLLAPKSMYKKVSFLVFFSLFFTYFHNNSSTAFVSIRRIIKRGNDIKYSLSGKYFIVFIRSQRRQKYAQ